MSLIGAMFGCFASLCAPEPVTLTPVQLSDPNGFRTQQIYRLPSEANWPFTVDEGMLLCTWILGDPAVFFAAGAQDYDSANHDDAFSDVRTIVLSDDVIDLVILNFVNADLFVEQISPQRRLEMVMPFFEAGARLCDQPEGASLPPGEL
ncbi:MAG: hypothetical protein AAFY99_15040 [Pseudomonadota bacterium]